MDSEHEVELVKVVLQEPGRKWEHGGRSRNKLMEAGAGDGADWFTRPAEAANREKKQSLSTFLSQTPPEAE